MSTGSATSGTYIKRFCGRTTSTVRSTTNIMTAVFTSDSSVTGRGFLANYTLGEYQLITKVRTFHLGSTNIRTIAQLA